jgi:hypothetical protein
MWQWPESCCVPGFSQNECQGINSVFYGIPLYGPFEEENSAGTSNKNLYTNVSIYTMIRDAYLKLLKDYMTQ